MKEVKIARESIRLLDRMRPRHTAAFLRSLVLEEHNSEKTVLLGETVQ